MNNIFWSTISQSNASQCVNLSKWLILVVETQDFGSMLIYENQYNLDDYKKRIDHLTICLSNASRCVFVKMANFGRRDPRFWLNAYF